jgi:AcrR family transcriptional regulator
MHAIATEAGVAVGTLYSHHPTKAALVDAVLEASVEHIAILAESAASAVASGEEPGEQLVGLLRAIASAAAESRALRSAARSLGLPSGDIPGPAKPPTDSPLGRTFTAFESILEACRCTATLRADATREDLSVLLHGVFELHLDEASRYRYIDIVLAGLALP